ncbi:caspase family protein [Flexithrix dorotheae]|uniref:caspase family protein n=1 Tax=Flexithrix dorotheae TaxID=70993 RepID=UPI000378256E|nr:caspase family protein [Flexithrix dorotheae]
MANILTQFRGCFFLIISSLLLSSCATIFSGTTQNVKISTNPGGARVFLNGNDTGVNTEGKIVVRRAISSTPNNNTNEQNYVLKKDGFEDAIIKDRRRVNGLALALDFLFPPSLIVDFSNGSIYKYRHKIRVDMVPLEVEEKEPVLITPTEEVLPDPVNTGLSSVDINIPETGIVNEDAIAIVIGNKNYEGKDIPAVDYATADSRSMKNYLIKTFGYREGNIIYIEDASLGDFNRIFGTETNHQARLYNLVKPYKSDVFVYYSGHGAPDINSNEGFLVPTDCEDVSTLSFEGYPIDRLYKNLSSIPYRNLTVVIDACFSGNTESGMLIKYASPIHIQAKSKILLNDNATIFNSSAGNQISSWYTQESHSLFTYYFLKGIQGFANDGKKNAALDVNRLKEYINDNVPYMARRLHNRTQTPEIFGLDSKVILKFQ